MKLLVIFSKSVWIEIQVDYLKSKGPWIQAGVDAFLHAIIKTFFFYSEDKGEQNCVWKNVCHIFSIQAKMGSSTFPSLILLLLPELGI